MLSVAVGAALLVACQGARRAAPTPGAGGTTSTSAAASTTTAAHTTSTASATTTTAAHTTTTAATVPSQATVTITTVAPTSAPPTTPTFAAITGTYYGGTADEGWLFVRSDGASRYRYPDAAACQCPTASAPIANIDFSLTSLIVTAGGPGHYRATGPITAESDPSTGRPLAGTIGSSVTVTIGPAGSASLSFLPSNAVLKIP